MHYNPDLEPDAIGSSDAVAVIDLPEIHIIITGHEEPGSVRATVVEGGSGALGVRDDAGIAIPGREVGSGWEALEVGGWAPLTTVTSTGYIKCAHDNWHNVIAFTGVSTLLLVILLGLIITRGK